MRRSRKPLSREGSEVQILHSPFCSSAKHILLKLKEEATMFIDYVPLMLINMASGLCLLAACLRKANNPVVEKHWASGFLMSGAVALACGFHMVFNWPLPGSYNVAFGELSVLLGILFAGDRKSVV